MSVDSACTALLGRLLYMFITLLLKRNRQIVQFFCSLKSLPLVVNVVAILKFYTALLPRHIHRLTSCMFRSYLL